MGKSIDVPLLGRHDNINISALVCASFSGVCSDPYAALSERASTVSVGAENCLGIVPIIAIGWVSLCDHRIAIIAWTWVSCYLNVAFGRLDCVHGFAC